MIEDKYTKKSNEYEIRIELIEILQKNDQITS